jgi:hypothetical protein
MVNAVAVPTLDSATLLRQRAPWRLALSQVATVLPSVVPLAVLRVWALAVAPKHGVYFTAEAVLAVYACFTIARAVHVHAQSCDACGSYDPHKAPQARQMFHERLRRGWARIGVFVLPLLLAALAADVLTAGTGIQSRLNVQLSMMFVELMAWWRYGSPLVIAAAQWRPQRPLPLARARCIVSSARLDVARTLAPAHVALTAAALAGLGVYGSRAWASLFGYAPEGRLVLVCSTAACALFASLALWAMCRGSLAVPLRVRERARGRRAGSAGS